MEVILVRKDGSHANYAVTVEKTVIGWGWKFKDRVVLNDGDTLHYNINAITEAYYKATDGIKDMYCKECREEIED